jgi:CheY-like chemotaxis protein
VASAIQALELFRLRSFDLILLDNGLAGLGAFELARRLRGGSPTDSSATPRTTVPILLIVGQEDVPNAVDVAAAGMNGVCAAPLELSQVLSQMSAALGRPRGSAFG